MWLSAIEYAEMMGLHPDTVTRYCREGRVPGAVEVVRCGNRWRIRVP